MKTKILEEISNDTLLERLRIYEGMDNFLKLSRGNISDERVLDILEDLTTYAVPTLKEEAKRRGT